MHEHGAHGEHQHQQHAAAPPPPTPPQNVPVEMPSQPQPAHQPEQHQAAAHHGGYESNPIKTFLTSLKGLWEGSKRVVAGLLAVQLVVSVVGFILLGIAALALIFAIFSGFLASGNQYATLFYSAVTSQVSADTLNSLNGIMQTASGVLVVIAVIAGALGLLVLSFLQASFMAVSKVALIDGQQVHFGESLALAFKKTWTMVLQSALITLGAFVVGFVLAFVSAGFSQMPGGVVINAAILIATIVGAIYFFVRLSLAPAAIFSDNLGPINALKYSWALTKKRAVEVFGAVATVAAVTTVVQLVFSLIQSGVQSMVWLSLLVGLVSLVVSLFLSMLTAAVMMQRVKEFKTVAAGPNHQVNYGLNIVAIVIAVAVSIASSSITNAIRPSTTLPSQDYYQDLFEDGSTNSTDSTTPTTDEELQKWLEDYYKDNPDLYSDPSYDYDSLYSDPEYDPTLVN